MLRNKYKTKDTLLAFLKYVFTEAPSAWLMGLDLSTCGSTLELAGTGCVCHGGSLFWQRSLW